MKDKIARLRAGEALEDVAGGLSVLQFVAVLMEYGYLTGDLLNLTPAQSTVVLTTTRRKGGQFILLVPQPLLEEIGAKGVGATVSAVVEDGKLILAVSGNPDVA